MHESYQSETHFGTRPGFGRGRRAGLSGAQAVIAKHGPLEDGLTTTKLHSVAQKRVFVAELIEIRYE